ncbi:hypothetical protein EK904_002205, partial [Melospiza melodia maxima]
GLLGPDVLQPRGVCERGVPVQPGLGRRELRAAARAVPRAKCARWTVARTACASAGPVAARRAGRERAVTSVCATPAAPSTGLVKMGSVNAERAGMGSTAP